MNLNIYTEEMAKSVWDKAFFMDKVPGTKCIVDFGCADGAMIRFLAPLFPSIQFFGYDSNAELIEMGREKNEYENVSFWHKYEFYKMIEQIKAQYTKDEITINFSSVLHEVFSETEPDSIKVVKRIVEELCPKFITIRDMYWDAGVGANVLRIEEPNIVAKVDPDLLKQYEEKYGHLYTGAKEITHFLMKYMWAKNDWEKELEENYYSWHIIQLLDVVDDTSYNVYNKRRCYDVIFKNHYQLPYLTERWQKEYGFYNIAAGTHAQFILRRM